MTTIIKLFFFITILIPNIVFAFPNNWKDYQPILVAPIKIDGLVFPEIWINPNQNNIILDRRTLEDLFSTFVKEDILKELKEISPQKKYLTKSDLAKIGIKSIFDENELLVYLTIPSEIRKSEYLDLSQIATDKGILLNQANFSTFLNFNYTKFNSSEQEEYDLLYNELNINYKSFILNTGGFYRGNDQTNKYHREYTRLIKDFEDNHSRLILGDLEYNTVDLQEQIEGVGFTYQNDFSINPQLLKTNFNQYEIDLKKPSTVEIFLNGSRIYKSIHNTGILNLNKLPLIIGLNNIKVLITDINGRSETLYFNSNYHSTLLPKGISDYSLSVLKKSNINNENEVEYKDQSEIYSGFYSYGLTDSFTLGGNFQKYDLNTLHGVELTKSFNRFSIELKASQSYFNEIAANSLFASIENNYDQSSSSYIPIKLNYRFFDREFRSILGAETTTKEQYNLNSNYFINSKITLGLGYQLQYFYDIDDPTQYSNLEVIYRHTPFMTFSIKGQKDHTSEDDSVLLSFNWFEETRNFSGSHNYQSDNHSSRNQINYNKSFDNSELYSSIQYDEFLDDNISSKKFFSQYDTRYGSFKYDFVNTNEENQSSMNLRFALAMTPNSINLTKFINNSFLVLASDTESTIRLNDERGIEFNKKQSVVQTNLTPYSFNTFRLNYNELPFGEEVEYDRLTLKPSFKSGTYYKIKTKKQTSLVFKVKSQNNKYINGVIRNDKNEYKFRTGKNGIVFIPNIKPGDYIISIENSKQSKSIEILSESGYINLGDINYEN